LITSDANGAGPAVNGGLETVWVAAQNKASGKMPTAVALLSADISQVVWRRA
jgi:hypothetical protein